jgi:serine/threonine protein kinase
MENYVDITQIKKEQLKEDATLIKEQDSEQTIIKKDDLIKKSLIEIKDGDNVDGYAIGEAISLSGGEADIRFAVKDGITFVAKIYRGNRRIEEELQKKIQSIISPYIVPILYSAEHNGIYFEIMNYYKHKTLKNNIDFIKESGKFLEHDIVSQLNDGLFAIHSAGLVHGDIKPENIFLSDDKKIILIGDFGITQSMEERTSITNINGAITSSYAAPEADEVTSKEGDYFSFGLTLLTLALGKHIFDGIPPKKIRNLILRGELTIPNEINADLADLICKLTDVSPKRRIGYEGVKKWLDEPICYRGCRDISNKPSSIGNYHIEYTFKVNGVNTKFYDLISLTKAMNDNWEEGKRHFDNNILSETLKGIDQSLSVDCKEINQKYSKQQDLGLLMTLHTINSQLEWKYKDLSFDTFVDYVKLCEKNYGTPEISTLIEMFDIDLISVWLQSEGKYELVSLLNKIFNNPSNDYLENFDIFINNFKMNSVFYYNGSVFQTLSTLTEYFIYFDWNQSPNNVLTINPFIKPFLSNKILYKQILLDKYNFEKDQLETIFNITDDVGFLVNFGYLILGHLPFEIGKNKIRDFADFVVWANKYFGKKSQEVDKALLSNLHDTIATYEKTTPKIVKMIDNAKTTAEKRAILYFYADKDSNFYGCKSIKELVKLLEGHKDLTKISVDIINDPNFKIWLASMGYKI